MLNYFMLYIFMSHGFLEKKNIPRRLILLDTFGYQGTETYIFNFKNFAM